MSMTPDGPRADYSDDSGYGREGDRGPGARNPADLPGIFLIIVGVIDLAFGGFMIFRGFQIRQQTVAEFTVQLDQMKKMVPQLADYLTMDPAEMKEQSSTESFVGGGVGLVSSILIILGGIRMRALQSYGLAVTAASLAIVPCLTCAGCCGLGQGVGIWSLVVLLNPDVKALFR